MKSLLDRPIGVTMTFGTIIVLSIISLFDLPISILPNIEAPELFIKVKYNNVPAQEVEEKVLAVLRNKFQSVQGVQDIESIAIAEYGTVRLYYEYGTNMGPALIEANEIVDLLKNQLPPEIERPQIIKKNPTDIPILKIFVTEKFESNSSDISEVARFALKRRIEQINGISLVDISGDKTKSVIIKPRYQKIYNLGLDLNEIVQYIDENTNLKSSFRIADGNYKYYVNITTSIKTINDLKALIIPLKSGRKIQLKELADIDISSVANGSAFYNNQECLILNVHKQTFSQQHKIIEDLTATIDYFRLSYPNLEFHTSQSQSDLLFVAISNLKWSLIFGSLISIIVVFLFIGKKRISFLIGISLPICILSSFLFFEFFNIGLNIISLSGLAVGAGMIIDNSIIVIDKIATSKSNDKSLSDSILQSLNSVSSPIISSVLTTLTAFVPLVLLSGISGELFVDQAISISIVLIYSIFVSLVLLPLLYSILFKGFDNNDFSTSLYRTLLKAHNKTFKSFFRFRYFLLTLSLVCVVVIMIKANSISISGMPKIKKPEMVINIDWNEQISIEENILRTQDLLKYNTEYCEHLVSEVGKQGYLFTNKNAQENETQIYVKTKTVDDLDIVEKKINQLKRRYPNSIVSITNAPNVFDQLFGRFDNVDLKIKLRNQVDNSILSEESVNKFIKENIDFNLTHENSLEKEVAIEVKTREKLLKQYGIDKSRLRKFIIQNLSDMKISDIKDFGTQTPIFLTAKSNKLGDFLNRQYRERNGVQYRLGDLLFLKYVNSITKIQSDKKGPYQLLLAKNLHPSVILNNNQEYVSYEYVDGNLKAKGQIEELFFVLAISALLIYVILTAQFESFLHPIIIFFTIPMGVAGSLFCLVLSNTDLNIMSTIGIIMTIGILMNDSILKVDSIRSQLMRGESLDSALMNSSRERFKPIIMTTLTTIFALFPILFSKGIGSDIQKPLIWSIIGGLTFGTFTSLYIIPIIYKILFRNRSIQRNN